MSACSNMDPWGMVYRLGREKCVRECLTSLIVNREEFVTRNTWRGKSVRAWWWKILPSYVYVWWKMFRGRKSRDDGEKLWIVWGWRSYCEIGIGKAIRPGRMITEMLWKATPGWEKAVLDACLMDASRAHGRKREWLFSRSPLISFGRLYPASYISVSFCYCFPFWAKR